MERIKKQIFIMATLLAAAIVLGSVSGTPARANPGYPIVTVGNVPLPVTGTVDLGSASAPIPVTLSGTPTIRVGRTPYHFRLTGSFDSEGNMSGDDVSRTIPSGKIFEMQHVACDANIDYDTDDPLSLRLQNGTNWSISVKLLDLQVEHTSYKRTYAVTQQTHAYLGTSSGLSIGSTLYLSAFVRERNGFVDCYVSGELIN